jgi:hypothetical protein
LNFRSARILLLMTSLIVLAACDSGAPATPAAVSTAITGASVVVASTSTVSTSVESTTATVATAGAVTTAVPTSSGPAVDTAVVASPTVPTTEISAPTPVTATAKGEAVTALTALGQLKPKALAWQPDARLVMLSNVRPGEGDKLLGVALGDPNVNEPTSGGLGRNWALIVFSPSTKGAIVLSMDGTQADLIKEGALTADMVQSFGSPEMEALDLSKLDLSKLADSNTATAKIEKTGQDTSNMSIAMLAPTGLGLGPLPTPAAGGSSSMLAYELFSVDPSQQRFVFFDAFTGAVLMDSATP